MTLEEAQSEIEQLKNGNKALADKNAEILDEMKKERVKNRESDESSQKFYKLQDEYDELKDKFTALEHSSGKSLKEIEKLTLSNDGLNATNTKLIIDDGLSKELMSLERFDVRNGGLDVTIEALKKLSPTIVDGKATFDGKTAKEFVGEWANSDDSKFYLQGKENSGGGSNGGSGQGNSGDAKYFDKSSKDFNLTKQGEIARDNPALYAQLSK